MRNTSCFLLAFAKSTVAFILPVYSNLNCPQTCPFRCPVPRSIHAYCTCLHLLWAIYKSGLTLVWPNRFASSSALPSVLSGAIVTIPLCASHSFVCATQAHAATTPYAYTDTIISGPNSGRCTEHSHSAADLPAPSPLIVNTSHCLPARDRSCLPFCFFFYRQVLRPL